MKHMMKSSVLATVVALALSTSLHAKDSPRAEREGYAEGIYHEYSEATNKAVSFSLKTIESGALSALAGIPVEKLTGTPNYLVATENTGQELINITQLPADQAKSGYLDDLAATVDGFDEVGFPVAQGKYRLLDITMEIDGAKQQHVALEACWPAQKHCVVFDPAVEFIDSEVANLRKLSAEGWAVLEHSEPTDIFSLGDDETMAKAGKCGLASRPSSKSRSVVFPGFTATYRNLYNIVVVQHYVGRVETGVRCDTRCKPQPFTYTNSSSGYANIGFNIKCSSRSTSGVTGNRAAAVAYSGCAHRAVLAAKFGLTAKGVGANVDINIDSAGTVRRNGRKWTDSCAYF